MFELEPGLHRIENLDVDAVQREAQRAGITTFVLPADAIVDCASFFDAIRTTFPLDPPLVGSHSWDALSDSLWGGLYTHPSRRILILWPSTQRMASSAPPDFKMALDVLADVAHSLADPRPTCGRPKQISVLIC